MSSSLATGKDVEGMRVDVLVQVFAHDERVPNAPRYVCRSVTG
jgi:hypothetical protein